MTVFLRYFGNTTGQQRTVSFRALIPRNVSATISTGFLVVAATAGAAFAGYVCAWWQNSTLAKATNNCRPSPSFHSKDDTQSTSSSTSNTNTTTAAADDDNDDIFDKDCPMCQTMLAGPCASQFRVWYACSKQGEGDDYLERCRPQFEALLQCLDENDSSSDTDD